jgi:hypothetical protein
MFFIFRRKFDFTTRSFVPPFHAFCILVTIRAALATPSMDTTADTTKPSTIPGEEPALRTVTRGVPDPIAIEAPVPQIRVMTEERPGDFDKGHVSHVVIQ